MKRYDYIYDKICDYDNLLKAHSNARKGKAYYQQVKEIDNNTEVYLLELQKKLVN